jgi:toluene monooxygenase system ferredoxin subunit
MSPVLEDATFIEVCRVDDLWIGEMQKCDLGAHSVLLLNVDGELHAYGDRCPHQGVSLSEGEFDGSRLTCRAHRWRFDAGTGRSINPAGACLQRFPLRIVDSKVLVGDQPIGGWK